MTFLMQLQTKPLSEENREDSSEQPEVSSVLYMSPNQVNQIRPTTTRDAEQSEQFEYEYSQKCSRSGHAQISFRKRQT